MTNNVLISGITGFVGSNLFNYLKEDYKVQGVSRKTTNELISYDALDRDILNTNKAFIHLAGKAHDLKNTTKENEYFDINFELTKKVFDKFLKSGCEVFIFMSSVKAVADEVEKELTEYHNPNPITAYGKSKLAAENYILSKEVPRNKRVYILRPCMIHGPNNKGNLNLLYNFVAKGIPYPFGKYENCRSFLSIGNLCFVLKELLENENIPSGIYNVADDDPLSTKDLVLNIGAAIYKDVKILNLPKFMFGVLGKIGDILPFPIDSEKIHKLTGNYVVANKKLKEVLKKKLPLSVEEGIHLTIKSFTK
ncbi:Nucleoside-diphosphate-sugar epimerase [Tenacibaculum sp. MAR_2009_124]|uniref:NAD-dependent epimerase/dehydratase family protein n=1 Tax=Tenacibaculum sp. MAR_2009_124 TaxID=1250059 RepID=UPI0008961BF1|nr:NAD-dependent epimerase/dehydratase family protein [Tenacibaculum sp. MAR_2009_124]SEB69824.1 Nucleoside-diphosphate-sugar epimerase [Tenacibaculum sp. MAR_2009_124]